MNTIITCFQLFGIGFSFGIAGPCFLICAPVIITYIGGNQSDIRKSIMDILIFLSGRFFAYIILGCIAGLSGGILRRLSESTFMSLLTPLGGAIIILLGIFIWLKENEKFCAKNDRLSKVMDKGGIFTLGFIIGISPCAPLLALLFEIALISKGALAGMFYSSCFGLGTFISGLIVVTALSGIFAWLPVKLFKSKKVLLIFKIIYSLLFISLGVQLLMG